MRALPYVRDRTSSTFIGSIYTSSAANYSFITAVVELTLPDGSSSPETGVELEVNCGGVEGYVVVGELYLRTTTTSDSVDTILRGQICAFVPTGASWRIVDTGGVGSNDLIAVTETIF